MARAVEMRFFGGMSVDAIACVLSVSPRTVQRYGKAAKLFVLEELERGKE